MRQRFLFINPWVYDFAAMNLWSRPLGLLKIAEYMSQFELQIRFIDCMDVFEHKRYGTGHYPSEITDKPKPVERIPRFFKRYGISLTAFQKKLEDIKPYDIVFITSIMSYWYPGVMKAIEIVRAISPNVPIVLGGIYATLFHEHASRNSGADSVYRGHIGLPIISMLDALGIRLKNKDSLRLKKGFGLQTRYYKLNCYSTYPFAPLLTSHGCPFRCAYCASSVLSGNFVQRDPVDVINEIHELYEHGALDFAFYDDALLVNADSHIKPILREIVRSNVNTRFHCPNGIHARFIDDELSYLMKESGFRTIRLSLETVNDERNAAMGDKVTAETLRSAVKVLKSRGFTKQELGVYIMYGLPGQELNEVREGMRFLKDLDVRIHLTEFSPIPQTRCWEELVEKQVITNDIDPLLTNNSVFSYLFSGYDPSELEELKLDVKNYNAL